MNVFIFCLIFRCFYYESNILRFLSLEEIIRGFMVYSHIQKKNI